VSETEKATQRVGQLLKARYRIDRVLHMDGQVCVYAGIDTKGAPNARVAIKLLPAEHARDRALHDRFVQRAYLANAIGHPGAVTVLDAGDAEDGAAFLITELIAAPSLDALRETHGGKLPLRLACTIVDQGLDILTCAHSQQIFHGALTPQRLFWSQGSQLKVLGFGAQLIGASPEAARDVDLRALAELWQWLVGGASAAQALPQSIRGVFEKASAGGWPSAEAMRRALYRAHRADLGSRIAGGAPSLEAPLSWVWIWLSATGLAAGLLLLSSLDGEPARPAVHSAAPVAQAEPAGGAEPAAEPEKPAANSGERDETGNSMIAVNSAITDAQQEPGAPPAAATESQRVVPRGPSLKALQLPMRGRRAADGGERRSRLAPVATAHRLCTELAARRREAQPLSEAEQRAWEEQCLKQ